MCQEVQEQKPWLSGTEDGRVGGSCVPAPSANVTAAGGGEPWKMLHPLDHRGHAPTAYIDIATTI